MLRPQLRGRYREIAGDDPLITLVLEQGGVRAWLAVDIALDKISHT